MKSLTVRGIPDNVYRALSEMAGRKNRSLQQQVRTIIEKETRIDSDGIRVTSEKWRKKLKGRNFGNITAEIRAERESR